MGKDGARGAAGDRHAMAQTPADEPAVQTALHDGWGELVLSRPHRRNALIGPMVVELRAGLADLLAGGARVVLVRGEGGAFCSGLDVDAFAERPAPSWQASFADDWAGFHRDLYRCPAVIIGALERFAINAGGSLALACDLLVAGEGAYLMVGEAAVGMHAPMNIAWLRLKTGEAVAAQLLLAAGRVPAPDLRRLSLVHKVVADSAVVTEARDLAARLAGYPGQGLASIKAAMRRPATAGEGVFDAVKQAGH
jgi:enoyl-CoA hydratase/carnithine racemase